jgi:16S rRNA G966 N2-methylase RsmD
MPLMPIEFLFNFCYTAPKVIWKRGQRMKPITKNTLFYGDNLIILREHIPDESVDLIYLDPPFNSNRNYKVLFKVACEDLLTTQYTLQNR